MPKIRVGLALGSGAARGIAHIGVISVLQKEGIPIDVIAGTSAGAAVGAAYAAGTDASRMKKLALGLGCKRLAPLLDPSLPKTGLLKGKKIKDWLTLFIGSNMTFSDLRLPFACIATDIETGEEIIIDEGPVTEAVRASISIPGIFAVVRWGDRYLVDGGLVNPVPVNIARRLGADFVIAVNVIPDNAERTERVHKERKEGSKEPSIFHVLTQSLYIAAYAIAIHSLQEADIVIEPRVSHIGAGDFSHIEECIYQGEIATLAAIPQIKKRLKISS